VSSSTAHSSAGKRILLVLAVALIHTAATLLVMAQLITRGMARFDSGADPSSSERFLEGLSAVLNFPVFAAVLRLEHAAKWFPGLWGYLPIFVNSVLWAVALLYIVKKIRRSRTVHAHVA
jgi:hypothetical protein